MTPEALRAALERHYLVHDYLCSCGSDDEFTSWDYVAEWIDHVISAEFPPTPVT